MSRLRSALSTLYGRDETSLCDSAIDTMLPAEGELAPEFDDATHEPLNAESSESDDDKYADTPVADVDESIEATTEEESPATEVGGSDPQSSLELDSGVDSAEQPESAESEGVVAQEQGGAQNIAELFGLSGQFEPVGVASPEAATESNLSSGSADSPSEETAEDADAARSSEPSSDEAADSVSLELDSAITETQETEETGEDSETPISAAHEEEPEDDDAEFELPKMYQSAPEEMDELRSQLGIVTKQDLSRANDGDTASSSNSLQDGDDESGQVLDLVQQVLGMVPESNASETEGDAYQALRDAESDSRPDSGVFSSIQPAPADRSGDEGKETENAAGSSQEAVQEAVQEAGEQNLPPAAAVLAATAVAGTLGTIGKAAASDSAFKPVMETWADVKDFAEAKTEDDLDASTDAGSGDSGGDDLNGNSFEPVAEANPQFNSDPPPRAADLDRSTASTLQAATPPNVEPPIAHAPGSVQYPSSESPVPIQSDFVSSLPTELPDVENQPIVEPPAESFDAPSVDAPESSLDLQASATSEPVVAPPSPPKEPPTPYECDLATQLVGSDFGQQMKELVAQILAGHKSDDQSVILFTGLEDDPGRANIVTGLAMYICAQLDGPTLLVDADSAKSVSNGFQYSGEGLTEALIDERDWSDDVSPTSCEQLRLLGHGNSSGSLDDETAQARVDVLIPQWKQFFSLVLIDGGHVDSKWLKYFAKASEATYIAVQLGEDQRSQLEAAKGQLVSYNANLKGCITTAPTE